MTPKKGGGECLKKKKKKKKERKKEREERDSDRQTDRHRDKQRQRPFQLSVKRKILTHSSQHLVGSDDPAMRRQLSCTVVMIRLDGVGRCGRLP